MNHPLTNGSKTICIFNSASLLIFVVVLGIVCGWFSFFIRLLYTLKSGSKFGSQNKVEYGSNFKNLVGFGSGLNINI